VRLYLKEFSVVTADPCHQIMVSPLLNNAALIQHDNAISLPNIRQSVSDQDRCPGLATVGAGLESALQGAEDACFCLCIQRCGGFVCDEDRCVAIDVGR
jgi:hypothetical protein